MNKLSNDKSDTLFFLYDAIAFVFSYIVGYYIKFHDLFYSNNHYKSLLFLAIFFMFVFYMIGKPYKNIISRDFSFEFKTSLLYATINACLVFFVIYLLKLGYDYSRMFFFYTYCIYIISSFLVRVFLKRKVIEDIRNKNKKNLIVVAKKDDIQNILYNLENVEFVTNNIVGIFIVDNKNKKIKLNNYNVFSNYENLFDKAMECNASDLLICCNPNLIPSEQVEKIVEYGIECHISIDDIYNFGPSGQSIDQVGNYRTLNLNNFEFSSSQLFYIKIKRILDIVVSLIAIVLLIPLYCCIKISYLLEKDTSPILYMHIRVGLNGKEFYLYKFRSMVPSADEMLKELLMDKNIKKQWDANHKLDHDPRITKIGNFLRKTSLDEFPQFINVLKGDMSLIGPRPLVPGELKEKRGTKLYQRVKPGITGWWACNGRSNISYEERLNLEYFYIRNCSFMLDIMCILKTIYVVIFQKGSK